MSDIKNEGRLAVGLTLNNIDSQTRTWESRVSIVRVEQEDSHGCGVACLAMISGLPYAAARSSFVDAGLGSKRPRRAPFSSNFRELISTLRMRGFEGKMKLWQGWDKVTGTGILKIAQKTLETSPSVKGNWHWVVVETTEEFGIVIHDPLNPIPGFERPPLDVAYARLSTYQPYGAWIQVDRRVEGQTS